jgi:hypothetical protein
MPNVSVNINPAYSPAILPTVFRLNWFGHKNAQHEKKHYQLKGKSRLGAGIKRKL